MKSIFLSLALLPIFASGVGPDAMAAGREGGSAAQKPASRGFTIQRIMSAPFPSDLVAAPAKGRFAWVFYAEGKRNIWVAEPGKDGKSYAARQITHYTNDDGQDVGELCWTPDGESIVYTYGGDLEFSEKPYPNPAQLTQGVEQDVWIVSLKGGEPRKLGEGHSPAVLPKGDAVAYVLKGQVWIAKLASSEKAEQLIHSRGESSMLRWSPDGKYLAFASGRGDHGFIGLYGIETKSLNYIDPGTDKDGEPVWSPDSKRIAFLRIPSSKEDRFFEPKRKGAPWSIHVFEVGSGEAREVWRAAEGQGSVFREVVAENQLFWTASDHIVFPWEKDGWTHLYSVAAAGGAATLLTPGAFEVEYVSQSLDRKTIVFSSNQDDVDRRHVWKIRADGNGPEALSSGAGIETAPVVSSDTQTVVSLCSDAKIPMRPAVLGGGSVIRELAPQAMPADFPGDRLVTPQQVIFSSADGMQIHAQLFLPASAGEGTRHPAVVFFHGGSRRQMLLGWHYMAYYSNAYAMNQYMASKGYVVLAVNYRSGIGYGMEFREALNYGAAGASEFNDVQGAGLYLRSRADVDAKKIGLWGGSYGGYLTALGLARSSDLFAAGVDMHGVHDWNLELGNFVPTYDPGAHPDAARLAWESSPLSAVKSWRSPVLLIHGDDDRNVPFGESVDLADALRKQGVGFKELIFPDEIHDFLLHRSWVNAYAAAAEFFDHHLASASSGPN